MTVAELIGRLEKCNPHQTVVVHDGCRGWRPALQAEPVAAGKWNARAGAWEELEYDSQQPNVVVVGLGCLLPPCKRTK